MRLNRPAVQFGELFHQTQPDPEPTLCLFARPNALCKQLEDARQHCRRDPDAGVFDGGDDLFTNSLGAHLNLPAGIGIAGGIGEQVEEDLGDARRVSVQIERGG